MANSNLEQPSFLFGKWPLRSIFFPLSILLIGIFLSISLGHLDVQQELSEDRAQVTAKLTGVRAHLEGQIHSTFDVTEGIAQLLRMDGGITPAHFEGMAKQAIALQPHIHHIALAPGNVLLSVYPLKGNEAILGVDYRNVPGQYAAVLRSRESRAPLLAGPIDLFQGGRGFIHRRPVFVTTENGAEHYWGSASVVTDVDALLESGGIIATGTLELALRGGNGLGNNGEWIWGNPKIFQEGAITTPVDVPGGTWELAAIPRNGWRSESLWGSPLFLFALTCTGFFTFFAAQLSRSHRLVRQRHAELAREVEVRKSAQSSLVQSEARFRALFERSPDPTWILRRGGICSDANAAALEVFGYEELATLHKIKATDISPLFQSDGQPTTSKAQAMLNTAIEKGVHRFEWLHKRADGSVFPAEVTLSTVNLSDELMLYAVVRDISDRKKIEQALLTQTALLQDVVDNAPSLIYVFDIEGNLQLCNLMFERAIGLSFEDMKGRPRESFISNGEAVTQRQNDKQVLATGSAMRFEEQLKKDKKTHVYLTTKCVLRDNGKPIGVLGISTDITEIKQSSEQLRLAGVVLDNAADGVIITCAKGYIVSVNKAFSTITGFSAEESIGLKPQILISEEQDLDFYRAILESLRVAGFWRGELWNRRKNGSLYPEWLTINTVFDEFGRPVNYVAVFSDISAINQSQSDLERMAHYDPVTSLPNRVLFHERLQHSLNLSLSYAQTLAVLVVDLDGFKTVNDSLGHSMGDLLLQQAGTRFSQCVRLEDTVSRLGGDEFAFILNNLSEPTDATVVAKKLLMSLQEPFDLKGNSTLLTASIGIAVAPQDSETPEILLRQADTAMYGAKEGGRDDYRFYQPEMTIRANERLNLERSLRRAVKNQEFEVWYQPKINLMSEEVEGAEALVRWRDPIHGLISPADFIPLAESTGLIIQIGELVIDIVCHDIRHWIDNKIPQRKIAVNVATLQIDRTNYVATLLNALGKYNLPASVLEVEVTESLMMVSPEHSREVLSTLQSLGITTAIDDFGTGYSSLSYLNILPINKLKIDKSFIADLPVNKSRAAITRAIVELGHALGFKIVAEGVETLEQSAFLKNIGCDQAQGYLYARPMPATEYEKWLKSRDGTNRSNL
ncbi:EAL domain-containing protein [Pseudomonas sp. HY13-MNA-CIBAN-0226]|uniref:bifunctional diguanylate cyclase/phosphodiesterase n=1 Tax=Pseudomonas sp. HY13-MNA-CIBAN-0226 TaxID=3140473 RepID=UPI003325ABAE